MKKLNLQPNSFLIRAISLFVAELFLATSILPAWAAPPHHLSAARGADVRQRWTGQVMGPTDLLRPTIAAKFPQELVQAVKDGGDKEDAIFRLQELGDLLATLAQHGKIEFRAVRKPGKGRQKVLVTYDPSEPKPLLRINGDRTATPEDYLGVLLAADLPPAMREAIVASARTSAPHLLTEAPDGGRRTAQDGGAKPAVYRIAPATSLLEGVRAPSRLGTIPASYP